MKAVGRISKVRPQVKAVDRIGGSPHLPGVQLRLKQRAAQQALPDAVVAEERHPLHGEDCPPNSAVSASPPHRVLGRSRLRRHGLRTSWHRRGVCRGCAAAATVGKNLLNLLQTSSCGLTGRLDQRAGCAGRGCRDLLRHSKQRRSVAGRTAAESARQRQCLLERTLRHRKQRR